MYVMNLFLNVVTHKMLKIRISIKLHLEIDILDILKY